jgi:hypothetical protein
VIFVVARGGSAGESALHLPGFIVVAECSSWWQGNEVPRAP